MRVGKELIGKPIYSVTDGRQLGTVKDLYLDLDLGILNGIFLGREGLLNRKARVIPRKNIAILGIDTVLVTGSDVVTDNVEMPEVEMWLRRENLQGRGINTAGGTKVGTVGDVLFDEEAQVVGFALARVFVEGPVAEKRIILKEAVLDAGGKTGVVTIDLSKAEQHGTEPVEPVEADDPAETPQSTEEADNVEAENNEVEDVKAES
jgi:uncharacterized protein YrrD